MSTPSTQENSPKTPVIKKDHQLTLKRVTRQLELKLESIQEQEETEDTQPEVDAAEPLFDEKVVNEAIELLKLPERLDVFEKITLKSSRQTKAAAKKKNLQSKAIGF